MDKQSLNSGASTSLVSSDMLQAKEATYISALNCAGLLTSFAASLDSSDFGSFWYSCKIPQYPIVIIQRLNLYQGHGLDFRL